MTIQELASQYSSMFERKTRDNDTQFYCVKSEFSDNEQLKQLCYSAHDGMMPDDWKYEFIVNALDVISDCENIEDIQDIWLEPDIYTRDLLNWVSSNLTRTSYCDDYIGECSAFIDVLMYGQQAEKTEVLNSVISSLNEILETLGE